MAQPLHDHHDHGRMTTTPQPVEDDFEAGPATALVVLIVAALLGFLIWLFAFSGIVFDNDSGGTVNIQENTTTNETGGTGTGTDASTSGTNGETTGTTSSP